MAHGKSLELQKFDREHGMVGRTMGAKMRNRATLLCSCGAVWASDKHFTAKGKLRAATAHDTKCVPQMPNGMMVKAIAAHQAGIKAKKAKVS